LKLWVDREELPFLSQVLDHLCHVVGYHEPSQHPEVLHA
jgi:hypothetical protein